MTNTNEELRLEIRKVVRKAFGLDFDDDQIASIEQLVEEGHPYHCACRQVWGDGECECGMYEKGLCKR